MKRSDHIPALDGLRGLAALLVVLAHLPKVGLAEAEPPLSGALGVMLFFILSGFLMGHLYLHKPCDRASVIRYAAARIARIFPLYYLVVIASYLLSHVAGPGFAFRLDGEDFVRLILMSGHNYVFWSIPPEIQFYFVFLLIWVVLQARLATRWLPALAMLVAAAVLLRPIFPGISVLGQLQIFLTGVGVAIAYRHFGDRMSRTAALAVQVASLVLIALLLWGDLPYQRVILAIGRFRDDTAYASLPLVLLVGSMMLAYTVETRFARVVFANRAAAWLGTMSFGLYLLHWPVMQAIVRTWTPDTQGGRVIAGGLGFAVTLAIVAALHYLYEMPMQKLLRTRIARSLDRLTLWLIPAHRHTIVLGAPADSPAGKAE